LVFGFWSLVFSFWSSHLNAYEGLQPKPKTKDQKQKANLKSEI